MMDKKTYKRFADAHAPRSPLLKNCRNAFLAGGSICLFGELLRNAYANLLLLPTDDASALTSITLVFLAAILSGVGVFDRIARVAGAGTLVPITGFANSVASPAIDSRAEGYILGVGAKIFTIAGPVTVYGVTASVVYGLIYWIMQMI